MNLIIPAAGKSSRFPNLRPKWLLTHPDGNLMVVAAIKGLNLEKVENVYLTILEEHLHQYASIEGIFAAFKEVGVVPKIYVLKQPTESQPETVYRTIIDNDIEGPIFIKDVDNFFVADLEEGNYVCTCDLNDLQSVNASNKSYVSLNDMDLIDNIVEKRIISSNFCVGGYSFLKAEQFVEYYEKMEQDDSLYISHIIFNMILDNTLFSSKEISDYCDWGTLEEWRKYKSDFMTIFLDIDGVLFKNSSRFFSPRWGFSRPLNKNIEFINKIYNTGKIHLVLTTSRKRKESYDNTIRQLEGFGVQYDNIIFDLPHCKRVLVNDFSDSNSYRSCDSVNVIRDSETLEKYFKEFGGA